MATSLNSVIDTPATTSLNTVTSTSASTSTQGVSDTQTYDPDQIIGYMDYLFTDYVGPWNDAMRKQAAYFKDIAKLEGDMTHYIKNSGDKDKPVEIDCQQIYDLVSQLKPTYLFPLDTSTTPPESSFLYKSQPAYTQKEMDDGEANIYKWARDFGAPDNSCVHRDEIDEHGVPCRVYYVVVDVTTLHGLCGIYDPTIAANTDGTTPRTKFDPSEFSQKDYAKTTQVQLTKDALSVMQNDYNRALTTSNNVADMSASLLKQLFDMLAKSL